MTAVETVERANMVQRPSIKSGDTVKVHVKVREGDKERIQVFEGMVIGMHRGGARATFTVRKVSFGPGPPRETLLPAGTEGEGGTHEGNEAAAARIARFAAAPCRHGQGPRIQDARELVPAHGLQLC